jgi:hypothetical protein
VKERSGPAGPASAYFVLRLDDELRERELLLFERPPEVEREPLLRDPEDDFRDEDPFVSPACARCLFTVAAAISLARFVDLPLDFALSLMCSYCRSRLLLQALGIERASSRLNDWQTTVVPETANAIRAEGSERCARSRTRR